MIRTMASVGCLITGSGTSSTRTSPASYITVAFMESSQRADYGRNQWLVVQVMTGPPRAFSVRIRAEFMDQRTEVRDRSDFASGEDHPAEGSCSPAGFRGFNACPLLSLARRTIRATCPG